MPGASSSFGIGVSLTPVGAPLPRERICPVPGGNAISGPFVIPILGSSSCNWIVYLKGTAEDAVVEWAATWDDQESSPDSAEFDIAIPANEPVQMFNSYTGYLLGITFYATVDGVTYVSEPVTCEM